MDSQIATLKRDGFVNLGPLLNSPDLETALQVCRNFIDTQPRDAYEGYPKKYGKTYFSPVMDGGKFKVFINLFGRAPKLDAILEKLFTDSRLKTVLEGVIGPDYSLAQSGVRVSEPNDKGLGLHQDGDGETGIALLLTDVPDLGGATVFIPKSHRAPLKMVDTPLNYMGVSKVKPLLGKSTGRAGDVMIFFNRTWHARFPNHSSQQRATILMSVFPAGYQFDRLPISRDTVESLPPRLRELLSIHVEHAGKEAFTPNTHGTRYIDAITKAAPGIFGLWTILRLLAAIGKRTKFIYTFSKRVVLKLRALENG